jgi:hypothetical protein
MTATLCLTRRRVQLELLGRACAAGSAARITVRRAQPARAAHTHLLALDEDGVWLARPDGLLTADEESGAPVRVSFEQARQRYCFTADAGGRFNRVFGVRGPLNALRLTLPLRVERDERRETGRLTLTSADGLRARLVHTTNKRRTLDIQLTDISAGGFGGTLAAEVLREVEPGAVFWAEITLADSTRPMDFVARLVHSQGGTSPDTVVTGWAFCPGDDETRYRANLMRLTAFVEDRRQAAH